MLNKSKNIENIRHGKGLFHTDSTFTQRNCQTSGIWVANRQLVVSSAPPSDSSIFHKYIAIVWNESCKSFLASARIPGNMHDFGSRVPQTWKYHYLWYKSTHHNLNLIPRKVQDCMQFGFTMCWNFSSERQWFVSLLCFSPWQAVVSGCSARPCARWSQQSRQDKIGHTTRMEEPRNRIVIYISLESRTITIKQSWYSLSHSRTNVHNIQLPLNSLDLGKFFDRSMRRLVLPWTILQYFLHLLLCLHLVSHDQRVQSPLSSPYWSLRWCAQQQSYFKNLSTRQLDCQICHADPSPSCAKVKWWSDKRMPGHANYSRLSIWSKWGSDCSRQTSCIAHARFAQPGWNGKHFFPATRHFNWTSWLNHPESPAKGFVQSLSTARWPGWSAGWFLEGGIEDLKSKNGKRLAKALSYQFFKELLNPHLIHIVVNFTSSSHDLCTP